MADLVINRGDLFPPLKATLEKQNESTREWEPVNLTDAAGVTLFMDSVSPGRTQVYGACVLGSPRTGGTIEYVWEEGDTAVAGQYRAQFEITWAGGKTQTIPNEGYATVVIQQDLAGDA